MLIIFPVAVGFMVFGDSVIYIVGGMGYISGTVSFRILMVALLFALLASVFTNGILIINRCEKYCLISTAVSATINVVLNMFFISKWGMNGAAITTVVAEMVNLIIQSYFAKNELNISMIVSKKNLITIISGSCMVAFICILVNQFMVVNTIPMSLVKVMVGALLSMLVYGILLVVTNNELIYEVFQKNKMHGRK